MSVGLIKTETLRAISDAVRAQNGSTTRYKPGQISDAISALETGLPALLSGTLTTLKTAAATVRSYACYNNTALTSAELTHATSIGERAFNGCSRLTTVRASAVETISYYAFAYSGIENLVLDVDNVPQLLSVSAFTNTPIATGTGTIYITDSLVDTLKIATNWSTYAAQILPLSDYTGGTVS